MNILSPRSVAFLGLAVLLSSCAPKRSEVALNTETTSATTLIDLVARQERKIEAITGRGMLSFESPEASGTAAFESSMKKPDSLLVILEGPFGIDVGTFFLSRSKYLMYNSLENRAITGVPSERAIRSVIPFDLTYEQILNAFSGIFPLPKNQQNLRSYAVEEDLFVLTYGCAADTCIFWIDSRYLMVTKYVMRGADGSTVLEATASRFSEEDGVTAPKRIVVSFPGEHRQIAITYSSRTLNEPHPSFAFSIPSNAHVIVQ